MIQSLQGRINYRQTRQSVKGFQGKIEKVKYEKGAYKTQNEDNRALTKVFVAQILNSSKALRYS